MYPRTVLKDIYWLWLKRRFVISQNSNLEVRFIRVKAPSKVLEFAQGDSMSSLLFSIRSV